MSTARFKEELDDLEEALKKLRVEYEKYFAGLERREPTDAHDKIRAWMRRLKSQPTSNTARRFRINQLQATLITYESYWHRICRQIEEGTYKRDRLRAQRLVAQGAPSPPQAPSHQAAPPDPLRELHASYQKAQREVGNRQPVSLEALARTVAKQTEIIKARYNCTHVEFKVAIKEGRAILKAVPK